MSSQCLIGTLTQYRLSFDVFDGDPRLFDQEADVEYILDCIGEAVRVDGELKEVDAFLPTLFKKAIMDLLDELCRLVLRLDHITFIQLGE